MRKKKKQGPARMKELGKVKLELWLTTEQAESLDNFTRLLNNRRATLARRFVNYVMTGGIHIVKTASNVRYD